FRAAAPAGDHVRSRQRSVAQDPRAVRRSYGNMANRREYYRHASPGSVRVEARLPGGMRLVGDLVDLSIGGLCIQLSSAVTAEPGKGPWLLSFALSPGDAPLRLPSELIHLSLH